MAAYVALVSLMNTIDPIMKHPHLSTSLDSRDIQPLLEKTAILLDFIEGWNSNGGSIEVADLERQITSAAHQAEDIIESHIAHQILAGTRKVNLSFVLKLQHIIQEMDVIMDKAAWVKENHGVKEEKQPSHSIIPMEITEIGMVGFDEELNQLTDELTQHRSNRHTVSIVGMGGMGKTTLVKSVYEIPRIKYHFDVRAWATVSEQYYVEEIFSQLLSCLGAKGDSGEVLYKTLYGRRYLITLDDIWNVKVWDEVNHFFPENGNGSCVVVTSRFSNVATSCGSSCFSKKPLNEDEGWELFCKKAFQNEVCPPELENVGKAIVKSCKGLPLSIVVTGGRLLKSPRSIKYWGNVANDIKSIPSSQEKRESLDVLFSSYNHLPAHLKPCFLYMGFLKTNFSEISVSEIISLWIAEGFLKSNGTQALEEMAEDYIEDLIDRNLILVHWRGDTGKLVACDIHDLLRDLCLEVIGQQEFFCVNGSMLETGIRLGRRYRHSMPEENILLRISDTDENNLSGCVNLRYLDIYVGDWEQEVLSTLLPLQWNLQTLILRYQEATIDIWKMPQLRYVDCNRIYVPDGDGEDECVLENLHTLKTALNLRLSEEVCNIIPNIKILHLRCDSEFQGYESCMENLSNLSLLHKLESLELESGPIPEKKIPTLPSSLKELTLSMGDLDWDDMTMIGSLPALQLLNLQKSYIAADMYPGSIAKGGRWSPITGQFLRLKILTIDNCNLISWIAESCHFPVLETLHLTYLKHLEEIPLAIGEIDTLKVIKVEWCSKSAVISALKIQNIQLEEYGNNDLQVQVTVDYSNRASLMDMVEREGLKINNIQFDQTEYWDRAWPPPNPGISMILSALGRAPPLSSLLRELRMLWSTTPAH